MTPVRVGVALLLIGVVCLIVVTLRVERMALEAKAEAHVSTLIDLRREAWNLQMETARLRAPEQIIHRVQWMELPVGAAFEQMIAPRADVAKHSPDKGR